MFAYLFERFPKASQTFCFREVTEFCRQGVQPPVFSLRPGDPIPLDPKIEIHQLPEGEPFARAADAAAESVGRESHKILRDWRGKRDSLRLHQAVYIGARLRERGIAHVHAHFAGMAARTAFWLRKFFGVTYSLTVHANDIFVPSDFEIGLAELFGSASAIVAVSDFAANFVRKKFPEVSERVHRIYNGIELTRFRPSSVSEPPLLLAIGRLIPKKGFDVLIEACALLDDCVFRCEIIGDGPCELFALINARKLTGKVFLTGVKSETEIITRLGEGTALVLPARVDKDGAMDNLPTVIIEAMASALPVVSTDVGGIPEMIVHGQNGLIVRQNDPDALADAMRKLLTNREHARAMGRQGRARAEQLFDIRHNVAQLRGLLLA